MLHRDYLLEVIAQFVQMVTESLRRALELGSPEAAHDAEQAIAELMDLDPSVAMQLAPESFVTMLVLTGIGDSVASYVAYTLESLAVAYDAMGDATTASLRHQQAEAVGSAFNCDPTVPPDEMADH